MKAEELMIGDLVRVSKDVSIKGICPKYFNNLDPK